MKNSGGLVLWIVFALVSGCSRNLSAQPGLFFRTFNTASGLSQSSVNCILQDRDGLIWLGTQDGLNSFDGQHFRIFQHDPSDRNSIPDNYILCMAEDKNGDIWIGTMSGGICRFNKRTEKFIAVKTGQTVAETEGDLSVWSAVVDNRNGVWFGTSRGLLCVDISTLSVKRYVYDAADPNSIPSDNVICLNISSKGLLRVATNNGLAVFDSRENRFKRIINRDDPDYTADECIIWSLFEDNNGLLLAGTNDGVLVLQNDCLVRRIKPSPGNEKMICWSVYCDNRQNYWIGTANGLYCYTPGKEEPVLYRHQDDKAGSLPENNVWCIMNDRSGRLWFGTNGGAALTRPGGPVFAVLGNDPGEPLYLSERRVNAILEDSRGTLWIGTEGGGLNRLDKGSEKFRVYRHDKSGNSICGDYVWSLAEDLEGNIWIGTYGSGLSRLEISTGRFTHYFYDGNTIRNISNNRILSLFCDREGMIWAGTRGGGLNRYDPGTDRFTVFMQEPGIGGISSNTILCIGQDAKGIIWIGTFDGGLNAYDKNTGHFRVYRNIPGNINSLSNNNIWGLLWSREGSLWLATQGGLNHAVSEAENLVFSFLEKKNGLPANTLFGLVEDKQGNLWMSSFNGLSRLDRNTFSSWLANKNSQDKASPFWSLFRNFTTADGLPGNEFNQGAYHAGRSGKIYFGCTQGLVMFNPDSLQTDRSFPPLLFTGFRIFNKDVGISGNHGNRVSRSNGQYFIPGVVASMKDIVMTYREKFFSFDFTALEYYAPEKIQYAYKLEGFDEDWNFTGTVHTVSFTNLSPGSYTLKVLSTDDQGQWNTKPLELQITILPPFYATNLFRITMVLLLITSSVLTWRRIIRNIRVKARKERERVELQLKTLKNQIDPHFVFNAVNQVGSFIYTASPDTVYDYFARFARLMRTTLKDSEKISRELGEELAFVKDYLILQQARFKDKFRVEWDVEKGVDMQTEVPKMIVQVHVENAIKHGLMHKTEEGLLEIRIKNEPGGIGIIIKDNGIGRAMAAEKGSDGTGKGMQIIDEINRLYNSLYERSIQQEISDLTDDAGNPAGTRVIIHILKNNS